MILLTTNPCDPNEGLCTAVWDATHQSWLATSANWFVAKPLAILVLIGIGLVVTWLVHRVIDRLTARARSGVLPELARSRPRGEEEAAAARRVQRAQTISSVLKSITSFVVFTIVAIMVISELGYDIGPLLAGAGIFGLALSFGAQSLVKDFISGLFMFFEDQYGIGDVITVNDVTGTVESLTLRVTRMRAEDGTVWYVRNGEILKVGNRSQP
ncbi:MAG: mechanosensitive ion channel [Nocardioidaceae bacterium]